MRTASEIHGSAGLLDRSYAENLYFFREHIDVVRRRLVRRLSGAPESRDVVTQVTA